MTKRIPSKTKKMVFDQWLIGNSYSEISKLSSISKGTISAIIKGLREENNNYEYLRGIG